MEKSLRQYEDVIAICFDLFKKKHKDYGASWRIMRLSSITDQIFIKAKRIRSVQEKNTQLVEDDINLEFVGILNYSVMALVQLDLKPSNKPDVDEKMIMAKYVEKIESAKALMLKKNHDYSEAWRDLRISSIVDLILQKIFRIKSIEQQEILIASEGLEANYLDLVNYAAFALILVGESGKFPKFN